MYLTGLGANLTNDQQQFVALQCGRGKQPSLLARHVYVDFADLVSCTNWLCTDMAYWISIFPLHGSGRFVVLTDVSQELSLQIRNGSEYASRDDVALDLAEPQLDFAIVADDTRPTMFSKNSNSLRVHGFRSMCIVRSNRAAWRLMYHRGKPVSRTMRVSARKRRFNAFDAINWRRLWPAQGTTRALQLS